MPSRGSKPKSLATPSVNGRSGRAQLLPAPATPLLWGRPSPSRGASPARAAGLIGLLGRGCRSHRAALAEDWYEPLLTAAPWKGPSGCARPLGRRRPRRLRDNAPGPDDPNQRRVPGTDVLGLRGGGWRRRRPDHRQHRGRDQGHASLRTETARCPAGHRVRAAWTSANPWRWTWRSSSTKPWSQPGPGEVTHSGCFEHDSPAMRKRHRCSGGRRCGPVEATPTDAEPTVSDPIPQACISGAAASSTLTRVPGHEGKYHEGRRAQPA